MLITGTSLSYCAKRCSVINTNIDARKWEVTVHSVTSNTPRGMLPVNSNNGKPLRAKSAESVLPCFVGRIKVKDKK